MMQRWSESKFCTEKIAYYSVSNGIRVPNLPDLLQQIIGFAKQEEVSMVNMFSHKTLI